MADSDFIQPGDRVELVFNQYHHFDTLQGDEERLTGMLLNLPRGAGDMIVVRLDQVYVHIHERHLIHINPYSSTFVGMIKIDPEREE